MARHGIFVGGKEVTKRYVGTRLVWEKAGGAGTVLLSLKNVSCSVSYDSYRPAIIVNTTPAVIDTRRITGVTINGKSIGKVTVTYDPGRYGSSSFTLLFPSQTEMGKGLDTIGWQRYSGYYQNVAVDFYGG
ncbi:hypothetical protein ABPH35_02335 [Streptococcus sp. ZJ93]|uniref:hypothetical protein n=1 Tax=Streptococcus handemini TaxID=3161188 RepID=UPI0034D6DA37